MVLALYPFPITPGTLHSASTSPVSSPLPMISSFTVSKVSPASVDTFVPLGITEFVACAPLRVNLRVAIAFYLGRLL